jgi:hypothetical protein
MSESSEGSSSEVNSPVSFAEAEKGKITSDDETMENFDLEVQLEDLMICHDDTSDESADTWKTGLELHEDDSSIFSSLNSKFDNRYQVLAFIGENSEELDENNNPVLHPANINRGAKYLAEGETADSLETREKVRLSVDEWRTIKTAVEHGTPIPTNANKNMLLGYHYALRQQSKQLAKERIEIQKRKGSAIVASNAARRARSDASYTNGKRHHRHGSRFENLKYSERQSLSKNPDSSFLSVDEQGNNIPKTPAAALVVAQAYLHTTRPNPGDPREHMHRASLNGLKMVGNKLSAKEEEAYRNKGTYKPRSPHRQVLGTEAAVDDLEHHHQSDTKAQSMEEPEDLGLQAKHTTTKTMKRRWGHHALPTGFAPRQYLKVSNYPMISKNMMDPRSHSHGSRIIYKQ